MNKPIWICMVTKNNFVTAVETIESIKKQIEIYQIRNISLLVLDKSNHNRLEKWIEINVGRGIYRNYLLQRKTS